MSTSPTDNPVCSKKIIHIIPREWNSYPSATLDCVVYSNLKEHMNHHKTATGAPVTIGEVSTKVNNYKGYIWLRKESDRSKEPLASEYSKVWIDNYACKHK